MIPFTGRTLAQHVRCSSNPIRSFRTVANSLDQRRSHLVTVFRNGGWVRIPGENLYLNRYRGIFEPEAYVTQSTTPVASSFQQVEPDLQGGTRTANRTPAEVPNADASVPVDGGGSGKEGEKIGGATESLLKKQVIEGVEMPVKPPAPASDECCMSGCARCVYDSESTGVLLREIMGRYPGSHTPFQLPSICGGSQIILRRTHDGAPGSTSEGGTVLEMAHRTRRISEFRSLHQVNSGNGGRRSGDGDRRSGPFDAGVPEL